MLLSTTEAESTGARTGPAVQQTLQRATLLRGLLPEDKTTLNTDTLAASIRVDNPKSLLVAGGRRVWAGNCYKVELPQRQQRGTARVLSLFLLQDQQFAAVTWAQPGSHDDITGCRAVPFSRPAGVPSFLAAARLGTEVSIVTAPNGKHYVSRFYPYDCAM